MMSDSIASTTSYAPFAQIKSVRSDLNELAQKVDNILGYRREIDHLLERVTALEKKLAA